MDDCGTEIWWKVSKEEPKLANSRITKFIFSLSPSLFPSQLPLQPPKPLQNPSLFSLSHLCNSYLPLNYLPLNEPLLSLSKTSTFSSLISYMPTNDATDGP